MELKVLKSFWGMENIPYSKKIELIGKAGYDGVEWRNGEIPDREFRAMLDDHRLDFVGYVPARDADDLERKVEAALPMNPLHFNVHGGWDAMSDAEGRAFFERGLELERSVGVKLCFETHRQFILYSPWRTLHYLKELPDLKINADFSHWVNVCERLPDDQAEALEFACRKAHYIHGRIGHTQGPQVGDPAAPEWATFVEWHEKQWDRIRGAHEERGEEYIAFLSEFGPPPYMPTLPHTKQPVADLWDVCLWMTHRIRKRWADLCA